MDKPIPHLMIPSSPAAATAAMAGSSNPFIFSSSQQIPSTFRSPFSNYFFPPPPQQHQRASSSSTARSLQPRPFGTFLEDISKLKVRFFYIKLK